MKSNIMRRAQLGLLLGTASLSAMLANPALAQAQADKEPGEVTEVVVTGSRLRGVAPVGSSIISLGASDIEKVGVSTTTDVLRSIPQVVALGGLEALGGGGAQGSAANVTRANSINLRGIGASTTLSLFDGRRVSPGGSMGQLVDASSFPQIAVERLEIVADGASAIYGSDAITGVVNVIPKKSFEGVQVRGRYAVADGYDEQGASAIAGRNWGSGKVLFAVEYSAHSPLYAKDRDYATSDGRPYGGTNSNSFNCDAGSILVGTSYFNFPGGNNAPAAGDFTAVPATGRNSCDATRDFSQLQIETSRTSLFAYASQEIGPGVEAFFEAFGTRRKSETRSAVYSLNNIVVPSTNAYFRAPAGVTVPNCTAAQNATFGTPTGTRCLTVNSQLPEFPLYYNKPGAEGYQFNTGLDFELGHEWQGKVGATYGRSDDYVRSRNTYVAAQNAALASSNPNTALNVFGGNNPANFPTLFSSLNKQFGRNVMKGVDASFNGPLTVLPGGTVRIAIGGEYRDEQLVAGQYTGLQGAQTVASYMDASHTIAAAFAELFVPIVGDDNALPFVKALDLSLAGRVETYSDFGSTRNPKLGLNWTVVDGLKVHASYGTSFRAPRLAESLLRSAGYAIYSNNNVIDPKSPTGRSTGITLAGGNPDIQPEEAKTYSLGVEISPPSIPGLFLGVNYFKLNYTNQINELQGQSATVLQTGYFDHLLIRNPTQAQINYYLNFDGSPTPINGNVLPATIDFIIDGRRQNLGKTLAEGLDINADYGFDTAIGRFSVGANVSYLLRLDVSASNTAPIISQKGFINYPPTLRGRGQIGWRNGPWNVTTFINYLNDYTNNTVTPNYKVASWTTFDLSARYAFDASSAWAKGLEVSANINNLFDKDPPYANTGVGYDPNMASSVGRLVAVSVSKRF